MGDTSDTILFAAKDYVARVGLLPKDPMDSFNARSIVSGKLTNVRLIAFNPNGQLFAVRGGELYTGSIPSDANVDWFSTAKRVGRSDWDKVKSIFFHPKGNLHVVTKSGDFYTGPAPSNENVSWLYAEATKIGSASWNTFDALFFDSKGNLHAVTSDDKLVVGNPPQNPNDNWLGSTTTIGVGGWRILSHFIDFGPDGDLWCVDLSNGSIYKGPIPTQDSPNYVAKAVKLGWGYNTYPLLSFTTDKTMKRIVNLEFLPESAKIVNESTEVLYTQIFKNKTKAAQKQNFAFSKTLNEPSIFSQDHGFNVGAGAEASVKGGVPYVAGTEKIAVSTTTDNNWTFTKSNDIQATFSNSSEFDVPSGGAIKMVASVKKAEIAVPYRADVRTVSGSETTIGGKWQGVYYYGLEITQEDYTG